MLPDLGRRATDLLELMDDPDCDPALLDSRGQWLRPDYPIPLDGGHLNYVGGRAHAECIAPVLGLTVKG